MGKKKIISMIVSIAMLVAMFPMIVHADGEPINFTTLTEMLTQRTYYQLESDCVAEDGESSIVVPSGANWAFDLNGHTISAEKLTRIFKIESGARLVLMNNSLYGESAATSYIVAGSAVDGAAVYIAEGGELSLNPGIAFTGNISSGCGGAIYCDGIVTVASDVSFVGNVASKGSDIYLSEKGTLSIGGNTSIDEIYLAPNAMINLTGFCDGSKIGISTETAPTADAAVPFALGASYGALSCFTSTGGYKVEQDGDQFVLKTSGDVVVVQPKIEYCNIVLDGKIGLYVYVDPGTYSANELANSSMVFNVGSRETDPIAFANGEFVNYEGQSLYRFRCDLSSMEMGVSILCMLKNGDETLAQAPLSVNAYLERLTANNRIPNGVEKAFVNFAYYMWAYMKSIHTEGEYAWANEYPRVTKGYAADFDTSDPAEVAAKCEANGIKAATKEIEDSGVTKVTFQLEFETTNAFMVYFYLDSELAYTANSIPVTVNGEQKRAYKVADNKYRVRINDIYLQDLETEYVITGNCGGTEDFSVTASPMSYVYTALRNSASSTAKKDAMVSVYWLWDMASRYNQ